MNKELLKKEKSKFKRQFEEQQDKNDEIVTVSYKIKELV